MAGQDAYPDLTKPFDASNEAQVKERELQAYRREKDNREVIATLLSSPQGRNWMWSVMSGCHVFETIAPGDPAVTNYLLGERNIGLRLLQEVTVSSPDALIQMMREKGNA